MPKSASSVRAEKPSWARRVGLPVKRDLPLALIDVAIVVPAYLMPLVLRFDGLVPGRFWGSFWLFLPVAALVHLLANYYFGLYGQIWRYASVQEARRVCLAGGSATIVVVLADIWLTRFHLKPVPFSVAVLGGLLAFVGFGGVRFRSRLFGLQRRTIPAHRTRILIIGAGDAGSLVLKDIRANPALSLEPVGVVDDDPRKFGLSLHGARVLGTRAMLPSVVRNLRVEQVLLAIPSATSSVVRDVAALCEEADVTLRVLPSVREIVGGRITARDIRDLRIEDLLGRQQVTTDPAAVRELLQGKRVLITGAGGSIGAEIVRQAIGFDPAELVLVDHDETHLHDIMSELPGDHRVKEVLADIRERGRMHAMFREHRPEVVFHAAAHKHVPLLETHPDEAILTNVLGTAHVVDAAVSSRVSHFVLISTDKAVEPASVMGSTKWFAEQIVRSVRETGCVFSAVRFGNVVGSRGSVIPTFLKQISQGGPVTVTDASMARYFMSIQEAVQLVLYAAALSRGGEVLSLDMGEPVNILDLARKLIRLSGRVPERDIEIKIVGARPGEKLVETLADPEEEPLPSGHPGVSISRPVVPDLPALRRALRDLEALVHRGDPAALSERVKEMAAGSLVAASVEGRR